MQILEIKKLDNSIMNSVNESVIIPSMVITIRANLVWSILTRMCLGRYHFTFFYLGFLNL